MGDITPRGKKTAALIAGGLIGLLLIMGAWFAGVAYGKHSSPAEPIPRTELPREPLERPSHSPVPEKSTELSVLGQWIGDLGGAEPGTVVLNLQTAGNLGANDGCNQGGGQWKIDGSTIHFSEFFQTLRGCLGVEDQWLFTAQTGEVSADGYTMELFDGEAEHVGTLYREDSTIKPGSPADELRDSKVEAGLEKLRLQPKFHIHRFPLSGNAPDSAKG